MDNHFGKGLMAGLKALRLKAPATQPVLRIINVGLSSVILSGCLNKPAIVSLAPGGRDPHPPLWLDRNMVMDSSGKDIPVPQCVTLWRDTGWKVNYRRPRPPVGEALCPAFVFGQGIEVAGAVAFMQLAR